MLFYDGLRDLLINGESGDSITAAKGRCDVLLDLFLLGREEVGVWSPSVSASGEGMTSMDPARSIRDTTDVVREGTPEMRLARDFSI